MKENNVEPAKRDDLPPGVAEELERRFKEMYPDMTVKYLGDEKDAQVPPKIVHQLDQMEARMLETFVNGE